MSDVFQEVDEELKRQQLDKAFRTYGPFVAVAAVLIIAGYIGYSWWKSEQLARAGEAGDRLIMGMEMMAREQPEIAAGIFAELSADAPGEYVLLAKFQEAAAQRQAGNTDEAVALYDEIAAMGSTPSEYRALAQFYAGLVLLGAETSGYADIAARLEPVADGTSPWRYHARESLAFAAYRSGQYDLAMSHYRQITDDGAAPAGVAARANEMLNLTEASAN